mmetsp:Transcript_8069/g.14335  ORF Transcript_8069/g.14335 Transcript_8069/m.14335 type:complete len:791 (+) Transcript_8069:221-2593(+)
MYFRTQFRSSYIDDALEEWEKSLLANPDEDAGQRRVRAQALLFQLLDDDDLLTECRSEGPILMRFFSTPYVLYDLVCLSLWLQLDSLDSSSEASSGKGVDAQETTPDAEAKDDNVAQKAKDKTSALFVNESDDKRQLTYRRGSVCTEILAMELPPVCDSIFANNEVVQKILSFIYSDQSADPFCCSNFAKIIAALLSSRHSQTIKAMQASTGFIKALVKRIRNTSTAEILIRILHTSDSSASETFSGESVPSTLALDLLSDADVLRLLAECFVPLDHNVETTADAATLETFHRDREEIMDNAVGALLGITMKMLQLPLVCINPPVMLNIYARADMIVGPMLDVGIKDLKSRANTDELKPVISLSLALRCSTLLMVTEANVHQSEPLMMEGSNQSSSDDQPGITRDNSGSGDGDVAQSTGSQNGAWEQSGESGSPPLFQRRKVLDTVVLEQVLVERLRDLVFLLNFAEYRNQKPCPEVIPSPETDASVDAYLAAVAASRALPHLGSSRLCVVELFSACLRSGSESTCIEIQKLGIPKLLLDMVLMYEWNSILHCSIMSCVCDAFITAPNMTVETGKSMDSESVNHSDSKSSNSSKLSITYKQKLWFKSGVIEFILLAWKKNAEKEDTTPTYQCGRSGYMGHVIRLADLVSRFVDQVDQSTLAEFVDQETLKEFDGLRSRELVNARQLENQILGGDRASAFRAIGSDMGDEGEEIQAFNMAEILDSLTGDDPNAVNQFAEYLLKSATHPFGGFGDLSHFAPDDADDDDDEDDKYDPDNYKFTGYVQEVDDEN